MRLQIGLAWLERHLASSERPFARRRSAAKSYVQICGDSQAPGDGLVPVSSALLKDSVAVELEDTAHGGLFGASWYGSTDRIEAWWSALP